MPRKNTRAPRQRRILVEEASMRPRPDAAEKRPRRRAQSPAARSASMRPRPDAAEKHLRRSAERRIILIASMRPRPDAAEKPPAAPRARTPHAGFNEAAARCRGKTRNRGGVCVLARQASMRPRPDAAEKPPRRPIRDTGAEASMRPRPDAAEKRPPRASRSPARRGFNEAAARCRGKTC